MNVVAVVVQVSDRASRFGAIALLLRVQSFVDRRCEVSSIVGAIIPRSSVQFCDRGGRPPSPWASAPKALAGPGISGGPEASLVAHFTPAFWSCRRLVIATPIRPRIQDPPFFHQSMDLHGSKVLKRRCSFESTRLLVLGGTSHEQHQQPRKDRNPDRFVAADQQERLCRVAQVGVLVLSLVSGLVGERSTGLVRKFALVHASPQIVRPLQRPTCGCSGHTSQSRRSSS